MLVVGQATYDRRRAEERDAQARAQERQQHFRIEEAAAIEQRENEIGARILEQRLIAIGEHQVEPQPFQDRTHLMMIDGMIAVLRVERSIAQRVLRDEHDAEAILRLLRDAERLGRLSHEPAFCLKPRPYKTGSAGVEAPCVHITRSARE